ncbi:MAG: translocation/assembly module TamB, partial [Desulfobacterales bacterium]|nr:translocation/assembly module TamB [Desulfobacterales bacterium]
RTGTTLKNIDVKLAIKGSRLAIERVQGTDGEEGVLSLHGRLDFSPDNDFPFQLDLILENTTLLRLDEATATAGGRLTLSGSLREALVAGKLDVGPVEIRIPDRLPPEMRELEIIEIDRGSQKSRQEPSPQPTLAPRLLFDVSLESPGRVFVRGRGLDSEWGGAIRITGSAHEPLIIGHLSIVRGHFNFLGKRFSLTEGSLSFGGAVPPAPVLDVTAEAEAGDMTALLRLSGPVSAPEVSLTSNPALPSDDVLCRLLFGRSVADITPIQAVRLAYAARTLAGNGGSRDLMGRARNLLGVDQLEIKQSGEESGEVSVGAGKYLGEGVYLEVERGLGPGSARGRGEVEVSPRITVETEVGGNLDPGIGIKWKRDY